MTQHILPDFGRPAGALRPVDMDHLYKDRDEIKAVSLQVTKATSGHPRDHHWTLVWFVGRADGYAVQRRVHIVQEIQVPHLTNWGAITKSASSDTAQSSRELFLKKMTLEQRKKLEGIGNETPVLVPNGAWNCQDWIITVLEAAEAQNLVTNDEWTKVISEARGGVFEDND